MKLLIRTTPELGYRCSMIQYHRIYSYKLLTHPAGLKVIKHQLEIWLSKRALKVKAFGTSGQPKAESCMAYGASSHLFRNKFAADSTSFIIFLRPSTEHLSTSFHPFIFLEDCGPKTKTRTRTELLHTGLRAAGQLQSAVAQPASLWSRVSWKIKHA